MTTTTTTFEGLALPHLAYGDAVHSMLDQTGLAPDVLETGLRVEDRDRGPELFLTLSWLTGHPDLADEAGVDLLWSHLIGWGVRTGVNSRPLVVSHFAGPALLADAVLHLVTEGYNSVWQTTDRTQEWEHARALDLALNTAAEQGLIAW